MKSWHILKVLVWAPVFLLAADLRGPGPVLAQSWDTLNEQVEKLSEAGQYAAALAVAEQMAELAKTKYGQYSEEYASALNNMAAYNEYLGRYAVSEEIYRLAFPVIERAYGPNSIEMAMTLGNFGQLYTNTHQFENAEPLLLRSIEILEKRRSKEPESLAIALGNLGVLYSNAGRLPEAEALHRRALEINEKHFGPSHQSIAANLNNLATVLQDLGRDNEVEQLYRRAMEVTLQTKGGQHPDMITRYNNLAEFYREHDWFEQAEPLYQKAIALAESVFGPDHTDLAMCKGNLAKLYEDQNRHAESEVLYRQSLAIREKVFGNDHPAISVALHNLASSLYKQGRYHDSEPLLLRALALREAARGPDSVDLVIILSYLASNEYALKQWQTGLDHARRAARIVMASASRTSKVAGASNRDYARATLSNSHSSFANVVLGAWHVSNAAASPQGSFMDEAFQAAQLGHETSAASALAQFTAREASGNGALAALARERQDAASKWELLDSQLVASSAAGAEPDAAAAKEELRKELTKLTAKIAALDKRTAQDFPEYALLTHPQSVSMRQVQELLKPDEALAQLSFLNQGLIVWFVTQKAVGWSKLPVSADAIDSKFDALVCGLDASRWEIGGKRSCQSVLNTSFTAEDARKGRRLPFDVVNAYEIYRQVFAPFEQALKNSDGSWKQLILAPGTFVSIPFQTLVTEDPARAISSQGTDFRAVKWLGTRQAITVIPSIAGFKALRSAARPSTATEPFLGFGNPLLDGTLGNARHAKLAVEAKELQRCPRLEVVAEAGEARGSVASLAFGGLADLVQLKRQIPLPETAVELCDVARSFGLPDTVIDSNIRLGAKATETEIKALNSNNRLANYRVLHFATHGALAGQVQGSAEPGLILTPPNEATAADDGYLTASEIAQLKLNADWIILSACNTAGGGSDDVSGLAGLARAFFYAGARAILVSHWAVNSKATVKLITSAFGKLKKNSQLGRAEVMRLAMSELIAKGESYETHPAFWAPFSVVGEGGAAQTP